MSGELTVTHTPEFQGITLWPGDGMPLHISDRDSPAELRSWFEEYPIQRAVAVARLRAAADLIESDDDTDEV